jgi:hypothetical protein
VNVTNALPPLSDTCPSCGGALSSDAKFCGTCGQQVASDVVARSSTLSSGPAQIVSQEAIPTRPRVELRPPVRAVSRSTTTRPRPLRIVSIVFGVMFLVFVIWGYTRSRDAEFKVRCAAYQSYGVDSLSLPDKAACLTFYRLSN